MDQTIYRLGAELLSVRNFLKDHPEAAALHAALQELTSAVDISGLPSSPSNSTHPDDRFIAEIALGLIGRGWPTLSSPFVEEALLSRLDPDGGLSFQPDPPPKTPSDQRDEDTPPPPPLTWSLITDPTAEKDWPAALARGLIPVDARLRPWDDNLLVLADSDEEKTFYFDVLPAVLGPLHACVEWHRPLESMVEDPDKRKGITAQIADFTIELPGVSEDIPALHLNLEVDGSQHDDWGQKNKDNSRDAILKAADWHVERIKTYDVSTVWNPPQGLCDLLQKHPVSRVASSPSKVLPDTSALVSELLLTPQTVARIQLAILLALRDGQLSLGCKDWFVLVREREVSAAWLALADLRQILGHLCALYELTVPDMALTIVEDHPFRREMPEDLKLGKNGGSLLVEYQTIQNLAPCEYDLAIDASVLCRPTQYYGDEKTDDGWVRLRTALRSAGAETLTWSKPREITSLLGKEDALTYFLQYAFRKQEFRPGQLPIIERALQRRSVIGLLPTGAGKSLTYQLPALLTPGITFVVDPIKSLMQDQVDNLVGVRTTSAIWINSDLEGKERAAAERSMSTGTFRFVFISPERLQIERFINHVAQLVSTTPVALAVIDEAHCVSEWGHDFRTAYLNLGRNIRTHLALSAAPPPIIALTGTASKQVLIDVQREIDVQEAEAVIEPKSYDRPELHFQVVKTRSERKHLELELILAGLAENLGRVGFHCSQNDLIEGRQAGIVFCSFVGGDYGVSKVAQNLHRTPFGPKVEIYSGKKPKHLHFLKDSEWNAQKSRTQRAFKSDDLALLAATSAFGMGIDKSNVRFTVHYGTPKSLEALAQEAGRAGRDGKPSLCHIIFDANEGGRFPDPIDPKLSTHDARARLNTIPKNYYDDSMRSLWLHLTGYLGAKVEARDISYFYRHHIRYMEILPRDQESFGTVFADSLSVKQQLKDNAGQRTKNGNSDEDEIDDDRGEENTASVTDLARIVHRLTLLGIVRDYTVQYVNSLTSRFTLVTEELSEEAVLENLKAYVERYDRIHAWGQVEADYKKANGDYVEKAIWALSHFVYRAIERQRREAIWNVRDVLKNTRDGEDFKGKLWDYLSTKTFGTQLAKLSEGASDIEAVHEIAAMVQSAGDARQLLGQTRRALESDPGNPSLRVIGGIARAALDNPDPADAAASLMLGFAGHREQQPETAGAFIAQALDDLQSLSADQFAPIIVEALRPSTDDVAGVSESMQDLAVLALPRTNDSFARRTCVRVIARRVERECTADVKRASATIREMLGIWQKTSEGKIDSEVRDVLQELSPRDTSQRKSSLAHIQFAFDSYRLVQDDGLKRACATPILHALHRAVQQVF